MKQKKYIKLTPPILKQEEKIGQKAGLRPYRVGGVRLEQEKQGNKIIIHNYGHGGAGVSVGFGYSDQAVDLFERNNMIYPTNREVAVIGSGYIGIYSALILAKKGFTVTIYSDRFIKPHSLINFDQESDYPLTSQIAGGVWIPCFYEYNTNKEMKQMHEICAKTSYNFLKDCIDQKKFKGLSYKTVYQTFSIEKEKESIPKDIDLNFQKVLISFDGVNMIESYSFHTILVEGDLFLQELVQECEKFKVNFVKKEFKSQEELNTLSQKYIFNCTGISSKQLFNDQNIYSVKGELAVFKPNLQIDYLFLTTLSNGDTLVMFPLQTGLTFGHYQLKDEYNYKPTKQVIDKICNNAYEYFNQFILPQPSL